MEKRGQGERAVIVVGVDQSAGAKAALRFALEEATLRAATLRVVHAWRYGYIGATGLEGAFPATGGDIKELREAAGTALEATLRESIPQTDTVEIERRVVEGRAAAVLVDESRGAELLVVGSRGHGGFAGLLLGSVSQQCAHHAACPVVIVPRRPER
jgi:nucleotide-binding universal stress UspA family protein